MRFVVALLASLLPIAASAQTFQIHGFLTARGIYVESQPSWTTGGIGRFDVGAASPKSHSTVNVDIAQLGADWTPTTWLLLHADGIGRHEPSGTRGSRWGLLQAFVDLHTVSESLRLRAGTFWLPTSLENIDPLWTSRYSITDSALNTWIGEEVRPLGVDLQYKPSFYFSIGATAFRGNDTMGTELAARGWSFGNRLSVYDEKLPLPDGTTTRAIGPDLDGRIGYSGRGRIELPERALLQIAHIDNRAQLAPEIKGQTPWHTRFNIVGASIGTTSPITLSAEWARGSTSVSTMPASVSTINFNTIYVLLSQKTGISRWTFRAEQFSTSSSEAYGYDVNRESGHAFTVAWLLSPTPQVRWGAEWVRVIGKRPGPAPSRLDTHTGGSNHKAQLGGDVSVRRVAVSVVITVRSVGLNVQDVVRVEEAGGVEIPSEVDPQSRPERAEARIVAEELDGNEASGRVIADDGQAAGEIDALHDSMNVAAD